MVNASVSPPAPPRHPMPKVRVVVGLGPLVGHSVSDVPRHLYSALNVFGYEVTSPYQGVCGALRSSSFFDAPCTRYKCNLPARSRPLPPDSLRSCSLECPLFSRLAFSAVHTEGMSGFDVPLCSFRGEPVRSVHRLYLPLSVVLFPRRRAPARYDWAGRASDRYDRQRTCSAPCPDV